MLLIAALAFFALYSNKSQSAAEVATTTPTVATTTTTASTVTPSNTNTYQKGDTVVVTAHIGQTVSALGEKITPTAVLDDSRCPTGVQCIWAGTVHATASLSGANGTSKVTFELGKSSTSEVNSYELTSVAPAKDSKQEIRPADYVFTFTVTRR